MARPTEDLLSGISQKGPKLAIRYVFAIAEDIVSNDPIVSAETKRHQSDNPFDQAGRVSLGAGLQPVAYVTLLPVVFGPRHGSHFECDEDPGHQS